MQRCALNGLQRLHPDSRKACAFDECKERLGTKVAPARKNLAYLLRIEVLKQAGSFGRLTPLGFGLKPEAVDRDNTTARLQQHAPVAQRPDRITQRPDEMAADHGFETVRRKVGRYCIV